MSVEDPAYLVARLHECLATDPRTNAPELVVRVESTTVVVEGVIASEDRRRAIEHVIAGEAPGYDVSNRTTVAELAPPLHAEEVR